MFAAGMMRGGGDLSFEEMKTQQLKEELAAHGSSRSGLKAALQRRMHGLLVHGDGIYALRAHRLHEFQHSEDGLSHYVHGERLRHPHTRGIIWDSIEGLET